MSIFRFQPSDLGTPGVQGGDVANAFANSFLAFQQNKRANQGMENEGRRLDIAEKQFGMQQEQNEYDIEVLRPLRESEAQLGLMSNVLGIKQKQQQLQIGAMELGSAMNEQNFLSSTMGEMTSYSSSKPGVQLGKVTSYGYQSDPYGDSASLGKGDFKFPTGAWDNKLEEISMAVSPDVERSFKQLGIRPDDMVELTLDDGSKVTRKWSDRTMQDDQATKQFGKPLTGRFDFYSPSGQSPIDGKAVVGMRRAEVPADKALAAPGVPAYAEAAAGANVASSVFTPQQTQWLSKYDGLVNVAKNSPIQSNRQQAAMMLGQLENNPEFAKTLGERNLLTKAAQNQAVITASIMGSSQPMLKEFQSMYPQYKLNVMPNGQIVPVNNTTGSYLDAQQQIGFMTAWETHSKNFDPYKTQSAASLTDDKIPTGVVTRYLENVGKYTAGKSIPNDAQDDESVKRRIAATEALGFMQEAERQFPSLGAERKAKEAAAEAERNNQPKTDAGPPTDVTIGMTVEELRQNKQKGEAAQLELAQMEDITATANQFAAELAKTEGLPIKAVNIAQEVLKGKTKPTGKKKTLEVDYGATTVQVDEFLEPADFYAKQFGATPEQVKKWAKATVEASAKGSKSNMTPEAEAFLNKLNDKLDSM